MITQLQQTETNCRAKEVVCTSNNQNMVKARYIYQAGYCSNNNQQMIDPRDG